MPLSINSQHAAEYHSSGEYRQCQPLTLTARQIGACDERDGSAKSRLECEMGIASEAMGCKLEL